MKSTEAFGLQKLILLSFWKRGVFFGGFRPHLEPLGHDGHVHVPTFGPISHVSGPKLVFFGNSIMVLKLISSRKPKTLFSHQKRYIYIKKWPGPEKQIRKRKSINIYDIKQSETQALPSAAAPLGLCFWLVYIISSLQTQFWLNPGFGLHFPARGTAPKHGFPKPGFGQTWVSGVLNLLVEELICIKMFLSQFVNVFFELCRQDDQNHIEILPKSRF